MSTKVFLFPGQASQQIGMGQEFFETDSFAHDTFQKADEILGFKISELCFNGPEDDLKLTQNTQPALLVVSTIAYYMLGMTPDIAAGHSLGEYSALVAAGALSFDDAVLLVHHRGQYMQEAVPVGVGAMAAIIGTEYENVLALLPRIEEGLVEIANWNSREQIVIAGHKSAVEAAVELIDPPKAVMLPVSAPFHTQLMKSAEEKLSYDLDQVEFKNPRFPIITNVDAGIIHTGEEARDALKRQVSRTVQWYKSISLLENNGVGLFMEVGSGKVLSGLVKRMTRKWSPRPHILNVENLETLKSSREFLGL